MSASKLLIDDNPLLLSPILATSLQQEIPDLDVANAGLVLQQIHYWTTKGCGKVIDGVRWIYNTYIQWLDQFKWLSTWKIRQIFYKLRDAGILNFIQPADHGRDRTGYYSINYAKLESLVQSHVCSTTNASAGNQHLQKRLSTNHIDTEITSENTAYKIPPLTPPVEAMATLKEEGENFNRYFLGIKSNQGLLATFMAMWQSIGKTLETLKDNFSAAPPPPEPKRNPHQYEADEPAEIATADRLRRLSLITGQSAESLRTNIGLQSELKRFPERFDDVLAYLELEAKFFKTPPGIGFVVNSLREGRKPAQKTVDAQFEEFIEDLRSRKLLGGVSYSSVGDVPAPLVIFPNGVMLSWAVLLDKGIDWEKIERIAKSRP